MKPYKRTEQRKNELISVNYYTINNKNEGENGIQNCVPLERGVVFNDRKNHGDGINHPRGNGSEIGSAEVQHQQSDAREVCSDVGFSSQDGRELRARSGHEDKKSEEIAKEVLP